MPARNLGLVAGGQKLEPGRLKKTIELVMTSSTKDACDPRKGRRQRPVVKRQRAAAGDASLAEELRPKEGIL